MSPQEPIGLLIAAVRRRLKQMVGTRVRPFHLSPQQFWLLVNIHERPGLTLRALADRRRMDAPTASRVVATLVRRRWVRVQGDPEDRRCLRLHPTAEGRALSLRLRPIAQSLRREVTSDLTPGEQESLRLLLAKVLGNLDRLIDGPER